MTNKTNKRQVPCKHDFRYMHVVQYIDSKKLTGTTNRLMKFERAFYCTKCLGMHYLPIKDLISSAHDGPKLDALPKY